MLENKTPNTSGQLGFSLVEVLVGAAILLISALAVAYLTKGGSVPQLDSLKACQDVNEEVLSAINSLGQGSFSYTYGTAQNYPERHCTTCNQGELGLSPAVRWNPSTTALTNASTPPRVRPHFLKLSSMTYLEALYNSSASYCTENGGIIPGATAVGSGSSPFNFFKSSGDASNLLKDRERFGNTTISIRLVNELGETSCTRPFFIRPQAQGHGDTSPALQLGVVDPAGAARVRVGFKVDVTTTYQEANAPEEADPKSCRTSKNFFYQPEAYRGAITVQPVTTYPDPASALSPRGLPICSGGQPEVAFSTTFTKAKRDSILLCRNRSVIGTWTDPAPCDPLNPTANCICEEANGCYNTWPEFSSNPDTTTLTLNKPNSSWFPCDLLGPQLVAAGILESENQLRVRFDPDGNGTYKFEVSDILHESPQTRPKLIRVDVIEVDSALNTSNDDSSAFATLAANFMGRDPGQVCTDCDGNLAFFCGGCPAQCDCPDYASANLCECNPTHPSCFPDEDEDDDDEDCEDIADPVKRLCCEDPEHESCKVACEDLTDPQEKLCCENPSDPSCSVPPTCSDVCAEGATEIVSVTPQCHGLQLVLSERRICERKSNGCTDWRSEDLGNSCVCPPGLTAGCSGGSCTCD